MKKKLAIIAAILAVCCLSACNNEPAQLLDYKQGDKGVTALKPSTLPVSTRNDATSIPSSYYGEQPVESVTSSPYSEEELNEMFESAVNDSVKAFEESLSTSETTIIDPEILTSDIVYHAYRYQGEEDGTMSYEPYILVEHNFKKNYVLFYMQFIGVNAFLSPDWDENLNVISGEYWIQDFGNADGSPPDLTKVYVDWSPSEIKLYYWNTVEECFSNDPQVFVISDSEDGGL